MSADRVPRPSQWLTPRSFGGSTSEDIDAFLLDYELAIEANGYTQVPADPSAEDAAYRTAVDQMALIV